MADIDTVYIHNDSIDAESEVSPDQVPSWLALGWSEGPNPARQAVRDSDHAAFMAAAKVRADAAAEAAELAHAEMVGDTAAVAELEGEPLVDLDSLPDVPPKGGPGSDLKAWLKFAKKAGIDLAPDLSRDEVIAVVEASISRSEALAAADETPSGENPTNPEEG